MISLNYNVANVNILYNVHVQVLLISGGGVLLITGPGRLVILLLCGEVVCVHTLLSSLVLLKRIAR